MRFLRISLKNGLFLVSNLSFAFHYLKMSLFTYLCHKKINKFKYFVLWWKLGVISQAMAYGFHWTMPWEMHAYFFSLWEKINASTKYLRKKRPYPKAKQMQGAIITNKASNNTRIFSVTYVKSSGGCDTASPYFLSHPFSLPIREHLLTPPTLHIPKHFLSDKLYRFSSSSFFAIS